MSAPWDNLTEAQRRQIREAHGEATRERRAELRAALDVLARRFAEEEAHWEEAGRFPPVIIAYSHNGYKITVERGK